MSTQNELEVIEHEPSTGDGAEDGNFELADDTAALATIQKSAIAPLERIQTGLAELTKTYGGVVYAVTTTEGLDQAKRARVAIRDVKSAVPKAVKASKERLKEFTAKTQTSIEAVAASILEVVTGLEAGVHDQITAEEARKQRIKEEKERAKQKKADAAKEMIDAIRNRVTMAVGQNPDGIMELITVCDAIELSEEEYGENNGDVMRAKSETLAKLREMHATQVAWEKQQADMREATRVAAIQAEIDKFGRATLEAIGKKAEQIAGILEKLKAVAITAEKFAEREQDAVTARDAAVTALESLHQSAVSAEAAAAAAAQQAAEAKRLEDLRVAQEAEQAEIKRKAAEQEAEAKRQADEAARQAKEAEDLAAARTKAIADTIRNLEEIPGLYSADLPASGLRHAAEHLASIDVTVANFGGKIGAARAAHKAATEAIAQYLEAATKREADEAERLAQEQQAAQVAAAAPAPAAIPGAYAAAHAEELYDALAAMLAITEDSEGVTGYQGIPDVYTWDEFEEVTRAQIALKKADTGASA